HVARSAARPAGRAVRPCHRRRDLPPAPQAGGRRPQRPAHQDRAGWRLRAGRDGGSPVTLRVWPRSLAARTAVVLLVGLVMVQVAGLTIHALDRIDVQRLAQTRTIAVRVVGLYRTVVLTDPAQRATVLAELHRGPGLSAELSSSPPTADLPEMPISAQRLLRVSMNFVGVPGAQRWREIQMLGGPEWHRMIVGLHLPDG